MSFGTTYSPNEMGGSMNMSNMNGNDFGNPMDPATAVPPMTDPYGDNNDAYYYKHPEIPFNENGEAFDGGDPIDDPTMTNNQDIINGMSDSENCADKCTNDPSGWDRKCTWFNCVGCFECYNLGYHDGDNGGDQDNIDYVDPNNDDAETRQGQNGIDGTDSEGLCLPMCADLPDQCILNTCLGCDECVDTDTEDSKDEMCKPHCGKGTEDWSVECQKKRCAFCSECEIYNGSIGDGIDFGNGVFTDTPSVAPSSMPSESTSTDTPSVAPSSMPSESTSTDAPTLTRIAMTAYPSVAQVTTITTPAPTSTTYADKSLPESYDSDPLDYSRECSDYSFTDVMQDHEILFTYVIETSTTASILPQIKHFEKHILDAVADEILICDYGWRELNFWNTTGKHVVDEIKMDGEKIWNWTWRNETAGDGYDEDADVGVVRVFYENGEPASHMTSCEPTNSAYAKGCTIIHSRFHIALPRDASRHSIDRAKYQALSTLQTSLDSHSFASFTETPDVLYMHFIGPVPMVVEPLNHKESLITSLRNDDAFRNNKLSVPVTKIVVMFFTAMLSICVCLGFCKWCCKRRKNRKMQKGGKRMVVIPEEHVQFLEEDGSGLVSQVKFAPYRDFENDVGNIELKQTGLSANLASEEEEEESEEETDLPVIT